MNSNTYLMCFLAGLLGIALHIFAVKIPQTKTNATVANIQFTYQGFFKDELAAILASLISVIACLILLDEIVAYKPAVTPYLKAGFVFVGFTGSSLLVAALGKAQGKINSIVDVKTNIADKVSPDVPPDQKV